RSIPTSLRLRRQGLRILRTRRKRETSADRDRLMVFTPMKPSLRSMILVCCWAAVFVPGCSRSVLTTDQSAALNAAEERWKRGGTRDYSFEYHPFSSPALGQDAARIEVRGGIVKEVTPLGGLNPSPTTIDELLGSIRQA